MSTPAYLKTQGDGVVLSIKVQPRASMNEIGEAMGAELKVKVTAPPVNPRRMKPCCGFWRMSSIARVAACS